MDRKNCVFVDVKELTKDTCMAVYLSWNVKPSKKVRVYEQVMMLITVSIRNGRNAL